MTLQDAITAAPQGSIPKTPFYAEYQGEQVLVRCVLQRTAVYELGGERHLAKLELFEPVGELEWFQVDTANADRARRGRAMTIGRKMRAQPSPSPPPEDCEGLEICGTYNGYTNGGCRGEACKAGMREYHRTHRPSRAKGARVAPRV